MSFGNLPTNIYELLGEEGETSKPTKSVVKSAPVTQSQTQNRSQKPVDNRQGQRPQGGNRVDDRTASDHVDGDKKRAPRGGKNPSDGRKPKGVDAPRLDRRSGTGRGKEIKKGGAGKGNWGSAENEEPTATAPVVESEPVVVEEPVVETEEEKAKREAEEKKREEERQKEERQMTLDEYLQKKKAVSLELPPARKPGEGATDSEKKAWASQELQKEKQAVAVPEKKADTAVVSQDKAIIIDSANKLSAFEGLGINVRVRDDARSRRKAQRFEEEKRRQTDERYAKPATEDPKLNQQKKKKGPYRPPQKTEENFPALSPTATKA